MMLCTSIEFSRSVAPGWHRIVETGVLVLLLTGKSWTTNHPKFRMRYRRPAQHGKCHFDDTKRFTYHSGLTLTESERNGTSP